MVNRNVTLTSIKPWKHNNLQYKNSKDVVNYMKRNAIFLSVLLFFASGLIVFSSCTDSEPEEPEEENRYEDDSQYPKERLILIYAIAANNLETNLKLDMNEILEAAPDLNIKNNAVLLYSVDNTGDCTLKKLVKNLSTNRYEFKEETSFDQLPLSTSEERISEVIKYVSDNYDYPYKGLILWSHADGWLPWFEGSSPSMSRRNSYGWDNFGGATYKTNITSLSEAIPENVFDFIWFDCCYMANIETIFQLKDKTDCIIGSVMEIHSNGMPYNLTMPCLLRKDPQLIEAAYRLFTSYEEESVPVSISVIDTHALDDLAQIAGEIFQNCGSPQNLTSIQTYQRNLTEKFYDLEQLLNSYSEITLETKLKLKEVLKQVVKFKLISKYDFNFRTINVDDYSGLSMHNYIDNGSMNNQFYQILDWFKATR